MLIVSGSVRARPDTFDQAHARLVFLEHRVDAPALHAHFQVPASGAFVQELAAFAATPPEMKSYDASPVPPRSSGPPPGD